MLTAQFRRLAASLLVVTTAAPALATGPAIEIAWSVNEGTMNTTLAEGTDGIAGTFIYFGELTDPATGLVLEYNLEADPQSGLSGNVQLFNNLDAEAAIVARVTLPYANTLPIESELSAFCAVGMTTNVDGGMIASQPPYLWQGMADGEMIGPSASLFYDPFWITHSGPASSSSTADFGLLDPIIGPPVMQTIGYELRFTISDGDLASVTTDFGVTGCPADLDTDGQVGVEDMTIVIGEWGPCDGAPCGGDTNGDAVVGVADFLRVLSDWGVCP